MKQFNKLVFVMIASILLTACQSKWDREVDLTPEEKLAIENQISETKEAIKAQISSRDSGKAEPMAYVNLARAYVKIGKFKRAERVYKSAIKSGLFSSALHNNLGRLYEEVGDYKRAIEQYEILINDFLEENYWYNVTWANIRLGERVAAEQAFNRWQRIFKKTDEPTQEALKAMRKTES